MKRILYLSTYIGKDCFFQDRRNENPNVDDYDLIGPRYALNKILMGIGYYICPVVLYLIYDEWKKKIGDYEVVIMDSRRASKYAVMWIKKKYPRMRVIVWYWNQVSQKELHPDFCKKYGCEVWSFDKKDCIKYGMSFNDQYLLVANGVGRRTVNYDLIYVGGWSEERERKLIDITSGYTDINGFYKLVHNQDEWIPYEKYIEIVDQTKGILEINKNGQDGLTLRALEALFYRKKLVTNNTSIVNEKIYNKKNIYIIGLDKGSVKDFLDEPYYLQDDYNDLISYYSFDGWIKRIYEFKQ